MGTSVGFNVALPPQSVSEVSLAEYRFHGTQVGPYTGSSHLISGHPHQRVLYTLPLKLRKGFSPPSPKTTVGGSNLLSRSSFRAGNLCRACSLSQSAVPAHSGNSIPQYPSSKDTGSAHAHLSPSALSVATNSSTLAHESQSKFADVSEGLKLPERTDSLLTVETLEDHANSLDPDLQGILANIADMQKQNEMLGERMKDIQELLGKTTRSLNAKAQEAKIEAAKLKKLAKLHHIEEIRRAEDVRRKVLEARMQLGKNDRIFSRLSALDGPTEVVSKDQIFTSNNGVAIPMRTDGKEAAPAEVINGYQNQLSSTLNTVSFSEGAEVPYNDPEFENEQSQLGRASEEEFDESSLTRNAVTQESSECVVAHPGALTCTKTIISSDQATKSAVVLVETTVKCQGGACVVTSLGEDDYVALAVQALADSVEELKASRFQRAIDSDPVQQKKHATIVGILTNGRVVDAKPMEPPSKFGHESFMVQLANTETGEKIDAVFKPGIEGNADGWHRAPIEMVAYKLNLMLGMDYVPPVIYRSGGVDVNYRHYKNGAFVYFVPNSRLLRKVPATNWGLSVALLLSDTRILDVLLNNSDRHHGHFLFGEHWTNGKMRPVLIDHAAGFRKEAVVKMDHENAFQSGPVRCVSAKTYLRLRFLEKQTVASSFQGILSAEEVNKLMGRRDEILSYLDNLVHERGYHRTVIES